MQSFDDLVGLQTSFRNIGSLSQVQYGDFWKAMTRLLAFETRRLVFRNMVGQEPGTRSLKQVWAPVQPNEFVQYPQSLGSFGIWEMKRIDDWLPDMMEQ